MKIILAIVTLAVGLGVAVMVFGAGDDVTDTERRSAPSTDGDGLLSPSPTFSPAPAQDPQTGTDDVGTVSFSDKAPLPTTSVSGPYLVASDALGNTAVATAQQRVFRTSDGTVAMLYHRPAGPKGELQEIIFVHSHDGGRTWHGEISVGVEAPDATYSGVMDEDGNLYVAYGRQAEARFGGAIKLRILRHQGELHGWLDGPEHRIVWDWPGTGSSSPALALTGSRLWLVYRYYDTSKTYVLFAQYADPDSQGDYPPSQWSSPLALVPPSDEPLLGIRLVPHGVGLSTFYTQGVSGVRWLLLPDSQGDPEGWRNPQLVINLPTNGQEVQFSAVGDADGNIHLTIGSVGLFVASLRYDGTDWSNPKTIAVNNVYGTSVATDGKNTWVFWVQRQASGYDRIRVRQWMEKMGWDKTARSPWLKQFGTPVPSVLVYRSRNDTYIDVTRHATSLATKDPAAGLAGYLEQPSDMLYLGSEERPNFVPLMVTENSDHEYQPPVEYWDGSKWTPLPFQDGAIGFSPPERWQPTEVNGVTKYYLRLVRDVASAVKVTPSFGIGELTVGASPNNTIDVMWYDRGLGDGRSQLWYGAVSLETLTATLDTPEHEHKLDASRGTYLPGRRLRPTPLPEGSSRQYISVSLDKGETYKYQLLDGQVRHIKLVGTQLVFRTQGGVTVEATATIEVSGPGLQPQQVVMPAAYFQSAVILHDVRVQVEITKEFDDFRLKDGGRTDKAARLMLSDARYSLTDISQYRWPFPGMMWGLGSSYTYYQGLQGSAEAPTHVGAFIQDVIPGTPVHAWHQGKFELTLGGDGWGISLGDTGDGRPSTWHRISPFDYGDIDRITASVELGEVIVVTGADENLSLRWGSGSHYDWTPLLAEWYVANSTPVERSYVKDWLVLGPYSTVEQGQLGKTNMSNSFVSPLSVEYLANEAVVEPRAGSGAQEGLTWRRFDAIVPGVVDVTEALSEFKNTGWAQINGGYPSSVAYLATYVHSPSVHLALLNIGSSDGVKVWVSKRVVLDSDAMVPVKQIGDWSIWPDFYQVPVLLQPGWNRILLKLRQDRTDYSGVQAPQNAWQLTFRISDLQGNPIPTLAISPEKDRFGDPLRDFVVASQGVSRMPRAQPPRGRHDWPEKVDLSVGESHVYTLRDGSQRTLKLLSYDIVIPRRKVEATVEVAGDGKTETHTLQVALAGVPVSINGLRLYAYAWKEANDFGFERVGITGDFPLTPGEDVGFAVSDARYTMYPEIGSFTYPYDLAFHEGSDTQTWLQPTGQGALANTAWAHSGYDIKAPNTATLKAWHDGIVWFSGSQTDSQNQRGGLVTLSTTSGGKFDDPFTWLVTHIVVNTAKVPSGTFVPKGTPLAQGGSHFGSRDSFDFGGWLFLAEVWNNEHKDDFPAPRYWLVLGPYDGGMSSEHIAADESGDLPLKIVPQTGDTDRAGKKRWKSADNFVNSIVQLSELLSESPFSGALDRRPTDSVAYAATYIYSLQDHTTDKAVWLKWGAIDGAKIWLNGRSVFDDRGNITGRPLTLDEFDVPLPLAKGWNTLIVKSIRESQTGAWRFSLKIGDRSGNRMPDLTFSARDVNLRITSVSRHSASLTWSEPNFHGTHIETYKLDVAKDAGFTDMVVNDLDVGLLESYTITGLGAGQEYFMRVKPYNYSEMGGSVYWRHFDVVVGATSGVMVKSESTIDIAPPVPEKLGVTNSVAPLPTTDHSEPLSWLHVEGDRIVTKQVVPSFYVASSWRTGSGYGPKPKTRVPS